jgi:hypothetical protein
MDDNMDWWMDDGCVKDAWMDEGCGLVCHI